MSGTQEKPSLGAIERYVILPWEVTCALSISLTYVVVWSHMAYRDCVLFGMMCVLGGCGAWRNRLLAHRALTVRDWPASWWRGLRKAVFVADLGLYFVLANH